MKTGFTFIDNGSGEVNFTKGDQRFLYKLAASCFENGSDGCDFILDDIPGFKLKTTIVFEIMGDSDDKTGN